MSNSSVKFKIIAFIIDIFFPGFGIMLINCFDERAVDGVK
jgi:hypothetical protein